MNPEDFVTLGGTNCKINKFDFEEFSRKIEGLFSEKTMRLGLEPAGLYVIFPSYSVSQADFSSGYSTFVSICYEHLLDVAKRIKRPLIEVNPIKMQPELEGMIHRVLSSEKSTIISLREIEHDLFIKLLTRLYERFTLAEELMNIFDSVIVYVPHLGLWVSNDDLLSMLRSFIKEYVRHKRKALVIAVTAGREELAKLNLSYERIGCIPTVTEVKT